ncbi:helix-turn-helix domain-containing protein [Catenovulum sp. SM1970]|uniref:AraC family transcriptional regulator n=1 Tax=Marinifaba aquimaris TaxID=2741323 RepID=UPI0015720C69|nr:helix-turn-helix domain-containing protein [Marinifaba aquimaris]NTS76275.1 helix-turn-helix domain-containing protein [Marinifaba aquimaris]
MSLDEIAEQSHFSTYHFHRIFHALVGESVNDYVFRKRMELAANRIACKSEWSITEIAHMGGF